MKLFKRCLTLFILAAVFTGAALAGAGSVLLAGDNAMFDYYHATQRQAYGWIMCFVPSALALAGAALFFLRRKAAWAGALGLAAMLTSPFKPMAYMLIHGEFITLIAWGAIVMFAGAAAACALAVIERRGTFKQKTRQEFETVKDNRKRSINR